jgi:hypothetical protein
VDGEPVEGQLISSAELLTEPVPVLPDSKDEGAEEGEPANEKASSPGGKPVPLLANAEVEQTLEEKAAEEKKAGGKPGMKKLLDEKKTNPFTAKDKDKDATKGKNSTKEDDSGGDSSRTGGGDTERKDSAHGGNGNDNAARQAERLSDATRRRCRRRGQEGGQEGLRVVTLGAGGREERGEEGR